jgi:hypothetical protein
MSKGIGSRRAVMSGNREEFWSTVPKKALHPVRVPMLEALWWIGEPLSAIELVDVFDGLFTMWEAAHHLQVIETLGVVEPTSPGQLDNRLMRDLEVPYRLKASRGDG